MSAARWDFEWTSVRELVATLRANYCGPVGLEYMHIADVEERRFLQETDGRPRRRDSTSRPEGKKAILAKVIEAEQYEKFLGQANMSAPSASVLMAARR
jgi:2-oxoglutarate dehydrogenase E1 component